MRRTLRLFASVKPSAARYLETGTPTGLTGLRTHGSPRSTLLYLYATTLERLRGSIPEHSLYRQSVEALTRHRLALVQSVEPAGYAAWAERAAKLVEAHPEQFNVALEGRVDGIRALRLERNGDVFLLRQLPLRETDDRVQEWDGELDEGPEPEGSRSLEEKANQKLIAERQELGQSQQVQLEPEPQLTAEQIEELETKIGAGLIEEVIQVAEGELKLIDTMAKAKVWESLEEKPAEGQWEYFERKS
ncbi:hypothetical protein VTK73DRAFT_6953 [Phialemonium thermophilum]|uniref:Uncharacterized protein n=1 Tax=Phialemonium thermophilum TaxID=223376 RepID=A0ABR3XTV0_9PEZI